MERELWLTSCFFIVAGLGLLAFGIAFGFYKRRRDGRTVTKAKVTDLVLRENPAGAVNDFHNCYYPVFEFFAEGKLIRDTYPYGDYPSPFHVGDEVTISFDPAHPGEYEICKKTLKDRLPDILTIAGAVLLSLGALLFIRFAARG